MSASQRLTVANSWTGTALAIGAALVSLAVMQAAYPMFTVSSQYDIGMGASPEARLALQEQTRIVERQNAMAIFACGGSLLSAGLAVVARACCAAPVRVLVGLAWGAIWGLVTGWSAAQAQPTFIPAGVLPSLTNIGMLQAFTFGLLGLGIGLMFGGFSRNARSAVASGVTAMIAGGGGGFLYAIIVGFVADAQSSAALIPAGALAQFLWLGLPFAAIGFLLSDNRSRREDQGEA